MSSRWTPLRALRGSSGFSLLEVMLALALMGTAVVALMELYSTSLRGLSRSADHGAAAIYARSMIESALAQRDVRGYEPPIFDNPRFKGRLAVEPAQAEDPAVSAYTLRAEVTWGGADSVVLTARKVQYDKDLP